MISLSPLIAELKTKIECYAGIPISLYDCGCENRGESKLTHQLRAN